jgi:hypothetical protein
MLFMSKSILVQPLLDKKGWIRERVVQ